MLTTAEILKKVRELDIKSKRLTNHLFTGEYHSAFKGRGMSFREVREWLCCQVEGWWGYNKKTTCSRIPAPGAILV